MWSKRLIVSTLLRVYLLFFLHFGLRITRTSSHNPAEPFQKNKRYTLVILDSFIFLPFAAKFAFNFCVILSKYLMDFGVKTYGTNQSKNAAKRGGINFRCWPLLFSTTEHWVCEFVRRHFYKDLCYMFPKYIPVRARITQKSNNTY